MDHTILLSLIATSLIGGVVAASGICTDPANHVWPLGPTMLGYDLLLNATTGSVGTVAEGAYQSALGYNSTRFTGSPDSYITMGINTYIPPTDNDDYSFQFYAKFADVAQGTILSFQSVNQTTPNGEITDVKLALQNGDLLINVSGYGSGIAGVGLSPGMWYHITLMRDKNQNFYTVLLDHVEKSRVDVKIHNDIADLSTMFPATVTVGTDGVDSFNGDIACLQFVPCKMPIEIVYDQNCFQMNWPNATVTPPPPVGPPASYFGVSEGCMWFELQANDVGFASGLDILETPNTVSIVNCANKCTFNPLCEVFTFNGTTCTLGRNGLTVFEAGSDLYMLV